MNPNEVATFRGFFIQARLVADDSVVGGFLSGDGYRLSSCLPPTVSQTDVIRRKCVVLMCSYVANGGENFP